MTDDDDILAAEFALGLLSDDEAAAAQARARTDAALSLRIAWWRDQLAPLVGEVATPAPAGVWQRIEAALPGNDNSMTLMQRWRAAAVAAMAVAAALLIFIGVRPDPSPVIVQQPSAQLIAAVSGKGGDAVAVSYNASSGRLLVTPTTLDPGEGDAELWVIPEGDKPYSLGVIDAQAERAIVATPAQRGLIAAGATLAISQEAKGGSTSGAPQGAIIATGKIVRT